jgi:hypothetical protein
LRIEKLWGLDDPLFPATRLNVGPIVILKWSDSTERVGAPPRQSAPFSRTLLRRPGRQIALQLPVRPTARPSLNIDMSTLVFADPSYDRELSGPSPSDPQRDNAGVFWKLALDRFEYGADTPLYFAFGSIDATTGAFAASPTPEGSLQLQRKPFKNDVPEAPVESLSIVGVTPEDKTAPTPTYSITAIKAYGISFDQLRHGGQPVSFADGDEIVVAVSFTRDEPDPEQHRQHQVREAHAVLQGQGCVAPDHRTAAGGLQLGSSGKGEHRAGDVARHRATAATRRISASARRSRHRSYTPPGAVRLADEQLAGTGAGFCDAGEN